MVTNFNRVRTSALSNPLTKTASISVHPIGLNFLTRKHRTHTQTDRHTDKLQWKYNPSTISWRCKKLKRFWVSFNQMSQSELQGQPLKCRSCCRQLSRLGATKSNHLLYKFNVPSVPTAWTATMCWIWKHTLKYLKTSKSGGRSFQNSAPKLWNLLPATLKKAENIIIFRKKLKTYLFDNWYG